VERGRHVVVRVRLDSELSVAAGISFGSSRRRFKLSPGPPTALLPCWFDPRALPQYLLDSYGTIACMSTSRGRETER
jgi:hypothetical protein